MRLSKEQAQQIAIEAVSIVVVVLSWVHHGTLVFSVGVAVIFFNTLLIVWLASPLRNHPYLLPIAGLAQNIMIELISTAGAYVCWKDGEFFFFWIFIAVLVLNAIFVWWRASHLRPRR